MEDYGRTSRLFLTLAAIVVVIAGMKASQDIMVPFLLALFLAVLAASPMFWLQRKGLPLWGALLIVVAGFLLAGVLLAGLVSSAVADFTQNLPVYQEKLRGQFESVNLWLDRIGLDSRELQLSEVFNPGAAMSLVGTMLNGLGGVLTNSFLILITVIFMLLEAAGFQEKIRYLSGRSNDAAFDDVSRFTDKLRQYIGIKGWISLATGVLITIALMIIGVDYPLLWGVLAFVLNFVPNIGSVIAGVPPVLLALIQLGPWHALATAIVFLVVNVLMGNAIEPRFMGKGLGLSTLVVFLSLVFWGWVFGPVGMLLSVPLTITLKIALHSREETRWISVLLGPDIRAIARAEERAEERKAEAGGE
ncbi:MAG: AI-2E family transporter [Gammaproteobacteria bacterium]|nr:AI-2E family transporter [Gammaproteobacteria bacterium]